MPFRPWGKNSYIWLIAELLLIMDEQRFTHYVSLLLLVSRPKLYRNRVESISLITYLRNTQKHKHVCTHVERKICRADYTCITKNLN